MNSKFRTKYDHVETFTPAGDPIVPEYIGRYDENGILVLDKIGEHNLYDEIQSHAESVDLNNIIRRYENGEVDVLARAQGVFADITQAPKTYAEMLNLLRCAEEIFDQLPSDIRAQFDNSFEKFFAQDGMSYILAGDGDHEKPVEQKDEVQTDES